MYIVTTDEGFSTETTTSFDDRAEAIKWARSLAGSSRVDGTHNSTNHIAQLDKLIILTQAKPEFVAQLQEIRDHAVAIHGQPYNIAVYGKIVSVDNIMPNR